MTSTSPIILFLRLGVLQLKLDLKIKSWCQFLNFRRMFLIPVSRFNDFQPSWLRWWHYHYYFLIWCCQSIMMPDIYVHILNLIETMLFCKHCKKTLELYPIPWCGNSLQAVSSCRSWGNSAENLWKLSSKRKSPQQEINLLFTCLFYSTQVYIFQ